MAGPITRVSVALAPILALAVLLAPLAARADVAAVTVLVEQALAEREPTARHDISFTAAPTVAPTGPEALVAFDYQPRTGAFSALIEGGEGVEPVRVTGRANAVMEIPALARTVAAGEHISASDIVWIETPANRLNADAITDPFEIEGQEAKRTLRAGVALRRHDVKAPSVIRKDELVTVVYTRPGISLAARGRALEDAEAGAAFRVLNLQSNRVIEAMAEGPGHARVETQRVYADASQGFAR
jgi:flagella basal body P-ring formation protein FlgA